MENDCIKRNGGNVMDQQNEEPVKSSKAARVLRIVIISVVGFLLLSVLCVSIFVMSFRSIGDDVKSSGYFQYIIEKDDNSNEKVVAVVGLTYDGMNREVIDVPREIDGKPVRYIGRRVTKVNLMGVEYYHFESDNLKKIYLPDTVRMIDSDVFDYLKRADELEIMLCSCYNTTIRDIGEFNRIYLYKTLYESGDFSSNYAPANIVFMNNYSDEVNGGYYRLDNVETGETLPEPPAPEREGYIFGGWYTEPECVTAWDFGDPPHIEEDAEFRLYAKWRAM